MKKTYFEFVHDKILSLNDSKFFAGIIMILLNIGSKFITMRFSKSQEAYLKLVLSRQLLIFSIAWMGTRDIYMALTITAVFIVLADFILNEESKFCILPDKFKDFYKILDTDGDGVLTDDEINNSIKILEKAKKMNQKQNNMNAYEKFHNLKDNN
jgi:hypothetical protein|tara:strand:- start:784 stop:1248 length:465 start_codon:yes stop_codon:yes gene_type:complete